MVRTLQPAHISTARSLSLITAEWAIARLQLEASHRTEAMHKAGLVSCQESSKDGSADENPPGKHVVELGKYHCTSQNHHGDLCVSSEGLKYISAVRKNLLWEFHFDKIKSMKKVGNDGLAFVHTNDEDLRVAGLKLRNEVFTQIIGYSGLRWQVSG